MKQAFGFGLARRPAPVALGDTHRPSEFHQVAEEHLRKVLADTLADLDVALGLCRVEDTMQHSVLMRAWNRIVGSKAAR